MVYAMNWKVVSPLKSKASDVQEIWKDLEMSDSAQQQTLQDITQKALGVWNGAVEHAEQHRQTIRDRINQAASEMRAIAEQLGELQAIEDPNTSMVRPSRSLSLLPASL
jgi:uncharacterized protein YfkK (UPF0435 family)